MKNLTLGLLALSIGLPLTSWASLPPSNSVCAPQFCQGFIFTIAGLYQQFNLTGDDAIFESHSGRGDYDLGYRLGVGMLVGNSSNDIMLNYYHYRKNAADNFSATTTSLPFLISPTNPVISGPFFITSVALVGGGSGLSPVPPIQIIPVTDIPLGFNVSSSNVSRELRQDVVDLELGQIMSLGCRTQVRWFGGLRYADLQRKQNVTLLAQAQGSVTLTGSQVFTGSVGCGTSAANDVGVSITEDIDASLQETISQKSDFKGIGPRFGLEMSYDLGCGFNVIGGASTSLLTGEIENFLTDQENLTAIATVTDATTTIGTIGGAAPILTAVTLNVAAGDITTQSSNTVSNINDPDQIRVVPCLDAKLALGYTYHFRCNSQKKFTIEAGYTAVHYWQPFDVLSLGSRASETTSFSLAGPYLSVAFRI